MNSDDMIHLALAIGVLGAWIGVIMMAWDQHKTPKVYVPEHGDHEPSWEITGASYNPPSRRSFKVTGFLSQDDADRMDAMLQGETVITQVCHARNAQGHICGHIKITRALGRASIPGFDWKPRVTPHA